MQEMKSQNMSSVNNSDDETLTDNDNRNGNDKIKSFPVTIISEDAQNRLPPLQKTKISPVKNPAAQTIDTFIGNDG